MLTEEEKKKKNKKKKKKKEKVELEKTLRGGGGERAKERGEIEKERQNDRRMLGGYTEIQGAKERPGEGRGGGGGQKDTQR